MQRAVDGMSTERLSRSACRCPASARPSIGLFFAKVAPDAAATWRPSMNARR
jgi:hypothetical protein